jgi:hypothetical protein
VCLLPKPLGNWQGIDVEALPPGHLIARLMQLPMMTAAERDGELIADFETQRSGLGKAQVMRIRRLSPSTASAKVCSSIWGSCARMRSRMAR